MKLDWNKLITTKRLGVANYNLQADARTEFERDYDRIIFSTPFRRLQDKTQVFPIPKNDFVHNRLTHSVEVASVGRSMGKLIGRIILEREGKIVDSNTGVLITADDFGDIVAAACLCHDIGNPPFGHSGEDAFRSYYSKHLNNSAKNIFPKLNKFKQQDFLNFEGNAEGFRILTNKHPSGVEGGLRLSLTTVAAFCKYTGESLIDSKNELGLQNSKRRSSKKVGFFQSEKEIFKKIAIELGLLALSDTEIYFTRHPLTFIVEAADNISYQIMDLEDAHKLDILTTEEVVKLLTPFINSIDNDPCDIENLLGIEDDNEKIGAFRAKAINCLIYQCVEVFEKNYLQIMTGEFDSELTDLIMLHKDLKNVATIKNEKVFNYHKVVAIESGGRHVIHGLTELYLDAFENRNQKYGRNLINMLPVSFRPNDIDDEYEVLLKITTYLSRMTDSYAIDQFRTLTGHKFPEI